MRRCRGRVRPPSRPGVASPCLSACPAATALPSQSERAPSRAPAPQPITRRPSPTAASRASLRLVKTAAAAWGGKMAAAPREPGGEAAFAKRIDPAREPGLSPQQRLLMAQVESAQRRRALQRRLRSRNVLLALGIGAVTLGIYGYTFYSVSQERFLDELEQEAEAARGRAQARAQSAAS
ncbi:cytochrome c oxidase assembly factor 3 homolog, mitochondrial [Colius striatus]|uniref:cytochrome c oxidase assembly factor 3 homolog, mitochondrial n=1 Tax=Colius striatus TaxID=57412 RepID=UPI002B1DDD44|nr:cytochrome c oxidase assembly factor 3 homolog, mitochondrial [Colius striatus]